jgi:hypothetical protein
LSTPVRFCPFAPSAVKKSAVKYSFTPFLFRIFFLQKHLGNLSEIDHSVFSVIVIPPLLPTGYKRRKERFIMKEKRKICARLFVFASGTDEAICAAFCLDNRPIPPICA